VHESESGTNGEVPRCPLYFRYWGESGSETDIAKLTRLTLNGVRQEKLVPVGNLIRLASEAESRNVSIL
jgi:hypothetical protein